jgi:hypothetical protein
MVGGAASATAAGLTATQLGLMGASTIAGIGGTLFSAYSSYQQGKYAEKVARNNAIAAEYQAQDAERRGQIEERQVRLRAAQLGGQQRSALAANGVQLGSGSALDVLSDTAMMGEADALTARHNAQMEAWGYRAQASNYRAEGAGARAAGTSNAVGSLLGGAGSVADKWYRYSR